MYPDVKNLAMEKIWSVPDSSNQYIVQPQRITPDSGASGELVIRYDRYNLPTNNNIWQVYMVGSAGPDKFNLPINRRKNIWYTFASAINAAKTLVDIYTSKGIQIPKFETYYMCTSDGNFLVAVKKNIKIDFDFTEDIYIRFYQNAYFFAQANQSNAVMTTFGSIITSGATITTIQNQINTIINAPGYMGGLSLFINGYRRTSSTIAAVVGDAVECVYDSSVYKVIDFKMSDLPSFQSVRDSCNKYLLNYPNGWGGKIDYQSNVDVYMVSSSTQRGVYVHKNAQDALRNVTYKDYSVRSDYLKSFYPCFYDENANFNFNNLYLRVAIRYDGIYQAPTQDANRQHYLLKLGSDDQVRALTGLDANIELWNAASLENSQFAKMMEARLDEITPSLAQNALGYSVVNYYIAKNCQKTTIVDDVSSCGIPKAFRLGSTAYEYTDGKLTGFYPVAVNAANYICTDPTTTLVEFIEGTGGVVLDETLGRMPKTIEENASYRFYMRKIIDGTQSLNWSDVTNDPNEANISNGKANWVTTGNRYRIIRSDKKHLAYTTTLVSSDGVLQHTLTYTNADDAEVTLPVPLGELDVWLNGKPLIEKIDYIFNFPTITIINKEHLLDPLLYDQELTVRMFGFCKEDLSSYKKEEVGFVWNGVISADSRYSTNYLKSARVVINGNILDTTDIEFVEDTPSGSLPNGKPYSIREYVNHLNGFIIGDFSSYYGVSDSSDDAVSNYLSLKIPQQTAEINPIDPRYKLYSPFICKVMYSIHSGAISAGDIVGVYSDEKVKQLVAPYLYLIESDPIKQSNIPDLNYCIIEPHWLDDFFCLSEDGLRFLYNVVRIYAAGLINLSTHVNVCGAPPPPGS